MTLNDALRKNLDEKNYDKVIQILQESGANRNNDEIREALKIVIAKHKEVVEATASTDEFEHIFCCCMCKIPPPQRSRFLIEVFDSRYPFRTMIFILHYIIESLPNMTDQSEIQNFIQTVYWILETQGNEMSSKERSLLSLDFVNIYRYSTDSTLYLLEKFMSSILLTLPVRKTVMDDIISGCREICLKYDRKIEFSLPFFARTIISTKSYIALVCSPEYYFERCADAFKREVSHIKLRKYEIEMIRICFDFFLSRIPPESFSRDSLPLYVDFLDTLVRKMEVVKEVAHRKILTNLFRCISIKFESVAQLLIIRRFLKLVLNNELKFQREPEVIGWLIDEYRYFLKDNSDFRNELGFIWSDLNQIRYEKLDQASSFFNAMLILAQYQALQRMDKGLMVNVRRFILERFHSQLQDYIIVMNDGNVPVCSDSMQLLQYLYQRTVGVVNDFLSS